MMIREEWEEGDRLYVGMSKNQKEQARSKGRKQRGGSKVEPVEGWIMN